MTEREWMELGTLFDLLERLKADRAVGARKLRLFAVACCRRVWHLLPDERSREAVTVAEQFADGEADERKLVSAEEAAHLAAEAYRTESTRATNAVLPAYGTGNSDAAQRASYYAQALKDAAAAPPWAAQREYGPRNSAEVAAADSAADAVEAAALAAQYPVDIWQEARNAERRAQRELVADIFGNPFRPVFLDPSWLTSTVSALAEGIYAERAFDRLPILADALQDAGCENPNVLDHCRGPGPHVRGCFVVDLLTGRK